MQFKNKILICCLQKILVFSYVGEPTNEEKLILALGLGSRGHIISNECIGRRSIMGDFRNSTCDNCGVLPPLELTPCKRKRSTCKERHRICSHIGM